MISVKDITHPQYRDEVKDMYEDYYESILGKDWTRRIPIKALREFLNPNRLEAEMAVKRLYGKYKQGDYVEEMLALGLFDDEILIGFACIGVFNDNTGGIYHFYVKPEYRRSFAKEMKDNIPAAQHLKESVEAFFRTRKVDSIILEVPHTVGHLRKMVEADGYQQTTEYADAIEYQKPLK